MHRLTLWFGCAVLLIGLHAPLLNLPFHWDEQGQFVPAALDLYRDGAWVPHSTEPNIHPPGVMALLAVVWSLTGYSIPSSRIAMLLLASVGVYFAFLLAVRLARGSAGAPAFAAVAFLVAAPMFYTQSMMVLLDMPAMVFTMLSLLLFLERRYAACAIVSTVLVLMKETAITTPMVFAAWLWFRDKRHKEALYFVAPALALAGWLLALRQATGSWFGNPSFEQYNVTDSLHPLHILYATLRRAYTLFFADGHWIGAIALWQGWRLLKGRDWSIALAVGAAQLAAVTIFGGAVLDRYLLPVLPILYIAFAVAVSRYSPKTRLVSNLGLLALLVVGWFWNAPYPFPMENNLAVVDFVRLQKQAAEYIESNYRGRTVVTAWPLTRALSRPEFGYIQTPIRVRQTAGLHLSDIQARQPNGEDVIVVYSRGQTPQDWLRSPQLRALGRYMDLHPEADVEELASIGFALQTRWTRRGQWLEIYVREPNPALTFPRPFATMKFGPSGSLRTRE